MGNKVKDDEIIITEENNAVKETVEVLSGVRPCNLFAPGTNVVLKDEDGITRIDPHRVELIFKSGARVRIKKDAVTGTFKHHAICNLLWNTLENYNNGEPFVESVMID